MAPDLHLPPAPLFDRKKDGRAFVPTKVLTAGARSGGPGRPPGRRASALSWRAASPPAGWRWLGTVILICGFAAVWDGARAQDVATDRAGLVAEAAARFALPPGWITAVMRAESGFDAAAVSSAGAMGLMQVMPKTYGDLRLRYGLGADPFHPRDNILAGAAYLREMYDRFGAPGFLAAYNAGPERYAQHLAHGRPLPLETRRYVAALEPVVIGVALPIATAPPSPQPSPPSVFVRLDAAQDPRAGAPSLFVALTPREVRP